ncbi:MAG TPA: hypothetical protein VMU89_08530 [Thermomicrobiaceae bacterium]|nr:hypothetical protein [Thermomicrobiaceae bacterium]
MEIEAEPHLLMAVLCQRAQQDQYGSFSVINVLEQLVAGTDDPNAPEEMPTFRLQANLVLVFASGDARGERTVTVTAVEPDGQRLAPVEQSISLLGEDHRATIISNLSLDIAKTGVYWFDVTLNQRPITRIPLRIGYERRSTQPWTNVI